MDLYNIPGDTGKTYRVDKFIEYSKFAPTVCHPTIIAYAKKAKWSTAEYLTAAFLHSLFYEELTAILCVELFGSHPESLIDYYKTHTPHTNPDKRRVVTMKLYPDAINSWVTLTQGDPVKWYSQFSNRKELRKGIQQVKNIGGFSADLFENCVYENGLGFEERYPTWAETPQLSEGMYLLMYEDERAIEIHKTGSVKSSEIDRLDRKFRQLCNRYEKTFPNSPSSKWYTKLCSFTNLFHGTRYGGYHHDRQLQNLRWYQEHYPEHELLWKRIYSIRKHLWEHHMLGELHDWDGIRPERRKLWLQKGLTGVEKEVFDKH